MFGKTVCRCAPFISLLQVTRSSTADSADWCGGSTTGFPNQFSAICEIGRIHRIRFQIVFIGHFQGNYLCARSALPIQSDIPNLKSLSQIVFEILHSKRIGARV